MEVDISDGYKPTYGISPKYKSTLQIVPIDNNVLDRDQCGLVDLEHEPTYGSLEA